MELERKKSRRAEPKFAIQPKSSKRTHLNRSHSDSLGSLAVLDEIVQEDAFLRLYADLLSGELQEGNGAT